MKILVLGSRIPWPLHDGGAIATYGMLKSLSQQGADVMYFSLNTKKHFVSDEVITREFGFCRVISTEADTDLSVMGALSALLLGKNYNISRFENPKANEKLENLLISENFDIIHFEGLYATPFFDTVTRLAKGTVRVLRQHNAEFYIWEKLARIEKNFFKKQYLKHLAKGLKKYETGMVKKFEHIVCISRSDEHLFRSIHPTAEFYYYPAGMEIGEEMTGAADPFSLYHIGSMEWMPNREGLKWFITEVWPAVRSKWPQASLHIAGKGLDKNDPEWNAEGVFNHGEVGDARKFQSAYAVCIVPLQSGSGLRMKTLEAMSLGRLVVSTSIGIEGIPAQHGRHLFVADTPAEWMQSLEQAFGPSEFTDPMRKEAGLLVENEFSLKAATAALLQHYRDILRH